MVIADGEIQTLVSRASRLRDRYYESIKASINESAEEAK